MNALDVSVLIVNWNGGDLLARCLASLPDALAPFSFEAIVVDNASTDDSLERVPDAPWLRIERLGLNVGFAAGTNRAAQRASGRHFLLLNPDTECAPGAVAKLVQYLTDHPDVGAVGPRLVHGDGSEQRSAWRGFPGLGAATIDAFYLWKFPSLPGVRRSETIAAPESDPSDVDHLLGACMLIPLNAWRTIGPLDEGFFLFLEETDWCMRARRADWRIVRLPAAVVRHYGEHSVYQAPADSLVHYYRSYVRFVRRRGATRWRMVLLRSVIATAAIVRLGLWLTRLSGTRRTLARGMLSGYARVLREIPGY